MQNFALTCGALAIFSLGLLDAHIDKSLFLIGKWALGIFGLLFVVSEGMVLLGA
jgi:hypothetical protein